MRRGDGDAANELLSVKFKAGLSKGVAVELKPVIVRVAVRQNPETVSVQHQAARPPAYLLAGLLPRIREPRHRVDDGSVVPVDLNLELSQRFERAFGDRNEAR